MTTPHIIGIDPSLSSTGVCTDGGLLRTIKTEPGTPKRLFHIVTALCPLIDADMAVIEDLPANAMSAGKTGLIQGAIRFWLEQTSIPYVTVTPSSLKKLATGKGNATKADMRMALFKRAGLDVADDNQVDAWWLREAGRQWAGHPDRLLLPATHLCAMDKVRWPA